MKYWFLSKWHAIRDWFLSKYYEHKYVDYEVDDYNIGSLKFIWGVKSWDDLSKCEANHYTMNDIDICYDRETKKYSLGIECIYGFENTQDEIDYLERLLRYFSQYMIDKQYSLIYQLSLHDDVYKIFEADSIPELYTKFKLFVEGYKKVAKNGEYFNGR